MLTLGSADPDAKNRYRMLATFSNRGAALLRIELSSPRYHDLDDRGGYLGHLVIDEEAKGDSCPVQVVGAGTPAAEAGLKPGDQILAVDATPVRSAGDLERALAKTKPHGKVKLAVRRGGKETTLMATLGWRPLEVVRPERKNPRDVAAGKSTPDAVHPQDNCPPSMLATFERIGNQKVPEVEKAEANLEAELPGVHMRTENWEVAGFDQEHVTFRYVLPDRELEVTKTYRLAKVPEAKLSDADARCYHLVLDLRIKNLAAAGKARKLAYRLDGPNGLPDEGWWFARSTVSRSWGATGMRDMIYSRDGGGTEQIGCPTIAAGKDLDPNHDLKKFTALTFVGMDCQFFSAVLMPQGDSAGNMDAMVPLRVGDVEAGRENLTNTSFRVTSIARELAPGAALTDHFLLFAGPKRPPLLEQYNLGDVLYYGWFYWVAKPMLQALHLFYGVLHNYGLAIILLTVLVRVCMFPMSRKQALGAQKMQELQPEIKKIQEKYKKDMEARSKAQQELFRKHNYNPLSGCLVLFIQLPIFVGLYRSLMVDVELRDAPLIRESVRWCSNLAAPDMLVNWSGLWNAVMLPSVNGGSGFFGLGPYFNILPIFTIVLFILQQKMFMPPPTDEQSAMQQKVMKYMMIFMGLMFYKVASGLCIYFIASSLWGLAERKLLPKTAAAKQEPPPPTKEPPRGKRRWPWPSWNGRDGGSDRKKKKKNRGRR